MEPIPLFTDTGCRTGHYAALRQAPLPFVFQSDQDYSGRDAPWRRCCCGGGEPWDCARRSGPRATTGIGRPPEGTATLSKPGVGRARTGDCGTVAADAIGALGECARRVPENGDRGVALPSPCPATTCTVDPGAGCTFEARRGGLLLATRARRPTTRSKPWGVRRLRVRRTCGRRVHPSPQADVQRSQRGRRNGPVGGRKAGGGMYYRYQADAIQRVRGRCRRSVAVVGPQQ